MTEPLSFNNRNIAITDLETTGLDPTKHEIIEIGLVLVKQPNLKIIDTLDIKVKPKHIQTADSKALKLNGYNKNDWANASILHKALKTYLQKSKASIFCAQNISFDLPFIKTACKTTRLTFTLDYHCIDIPTLAWYFMRNKEIEKLNLNKIAEFLGIKPEPDIHRAINGAMLAYEVLKKLVLERNPK